MKQDLKDRALSIYSFFKKKNLEDLYLYSDSDFNDYYIVVKDEVCDTEKYDLAIDEYMRTFDISNTHVLSERYLLNKKCLFLVDKFIVFDGINPTKYSFLRLSKSDIKINMGHYKSINEYKPVQEEIDISNDYWVA